MVDFKSLFESAPGLYLVLLPDLTIVAVSDAYANTTMTKRQEITGRGLFDVFPDNPDDIGATGVSNLRASLNHVLHNKTAHTMAVQKYDIRRRDGSFEVRYWSPLNKPVLNDNDEVVYIIHRVEDVTEFIRSKTEQEYKDKLNENLQRQVQEMEMEIFARAQNIQLMNMNLEKKVQERTAELSHSENRFRAIIEQFPYPVVTYEPDGTYTTANEAWETMWNEKRENVKGYNIRKDKQLIASGLSQYVEKAFEGEVAISKPYLYDPALIGHEGRRRWMQMTMYPLKNANGKLMEVILVLQDVTENKEAEQQIIELNESLERKVTERTTQLAQANNDLESYIIQLKESEEKFSKIFESSPVGISIGKLPSGVIVDANKSFLQMFDYNREEVLGRTSTELNMIDSAEREKIKHDLIEFGTVRDKEIMVRRKYGEEFLSLISLDNCSIKGEQYGITISYDISERKKAEEQLAAANKEMEAFSYSVSHDLRTPLRAINGYASILEEDYSNSLDKEGKRLLNKVKQNAQKMGLLIDELLEFSRLGRKDVKKSFIDMNVLTYNAIAEINQATPHSTHINIDHLHSVTGDYALLNQVMINLVANAIKYSSKKEKPMIRIQSRIENGELIFSISDNGVGFEMEYVHKLFGVFQRLHGAEEFPGTGVGLAIVHRIINKHGGRVWAEGKLNEGAVFYFAIPEVKQDYLHHS